MNQISALELETFITNALHEDVRDGDHTSLACVPREAVGKARLLIKDKGIIAGVRIAEKICKHVNPNSIFKVLIEDGSEIQPGDIAFEMEMPSQDILKLERLLLNTMQRMSGIATMTNMFVNKVKGLPVKILDTRKTTPLLRFLEKLAVRIGGGDNYRDGLYDRIMIKDNHVDFCGSITEAINKVHNYLKKNLLNLEITVEVRNFIELEETLSVGGINRIMMDNFNIQDLYKAVDLVNGRYETEASGGINLDTVRAYAETGVDFISVGALTHSYNSLDLSLKKY